MALTSSSVFGTPLVQPRPKVIAHVKEPSPVLNAPNAFSFLALTFTGTALPLLDKTQTTTFGLLFSGFGGLFVLAAVLCGVIAFIVSLAQRRVATAWVAIFATIIAFRLPTVFASGVPMYGWTYKHLGVIDYIQTHGNVATNVDIYFSWPAMFTMVAWFCALTGIKALTLANWFILFIHFAQAFAVFALARSLRRTVFQALAAVFVAEVLNWIGQDYFSPQALGFVLAILTLALLFHSRKRALYAWLSVPMFFALAITHQLTPYWICLVVFFACVFKFVRPRYMFMVYGAIALAWMVLHYYALARYGIFSGFNPVGNAERPQLGAAVLGRTVTQYGMQATAVITWGTAALILLVNLIRTRNYKLYVWMPLALTFSSFVLLGGQNYGGEAIFRVLLYSLPGAGIIIGTALADIIVWARGKKVKSFLKIAVVLPIVLAVTTVSLQAQYGTWFANIVDKSALTVNEEMMKTLPTGTYLLGFAPAGPGRTSAEYVKWAEKNPSFDGAFAQFDPKKYLNQDFKTDRLENDMTVTLQNLNAPVTLSWTREMQNYSDYYGLFPKTAFKNLIAQLKKDDRWVVTVNNSDIIVFELKGSI